VNRDNVVSFDAFARGRSARRGADDKLPFDASGMVEVECPRCAAALCVDVDLLSDGADVMCGGCDATVAFRDEALDVQRR
jgi:transcription elongation factor Elf1